MNIQYQKLRFEPKTLAKIAAANKIIGEYKKMGYELTLRQLYYQFVARDLIKNNQQEYKALGETISKARLAGKISWRAIVDRTRFIRTSQSWDTPSDILSGAAYSFRRDIWENQSNMIEVWVEKDALVGVVERAASEYHLPYFSCRGYVSQSEMWEAAQRLMRYVARGQSVTILHLGDHDPSGIDMTRDITERLRLFDDESLAHIEIKRIALNMDQVEEHNPPPNFAKESDSRYNDYQSEFGDDCWELDALTPDIINEVILAEVKPLIEQEKWDAVLAQDNADKDVLRSIAADYEVIKAWLAVRNTTLAVSREDVDTLLEAYSRLPTRLQRFVEERVTDALDRIEVVRNADG